MSLSPSPQPVTPRDYVRAQFREAYAEQHERRERAPIAQRWRVLPWPESRVAIGHGETEELAWLNAMRWIRSTQGDE